MAAAEIRYVRLTPAERLSRLRQRLAAYENKDTIRRLAESASELALTAPENLLEDIAAFVDRVHAKLDRLSAASEKPKRQAVRVAATDRVGATSPLIEMKIGAWQVDEFGNQSRFIWNAGGPPPP